MPAPAWVDEADGQVTTRYRVKGTLYQGRSRFQDIRIVDTEAYGRMLILDGCVQTTEKDEFIYHEMMTHVPMLSHARPEHVLIIGGGDGGILREVLRYDSVQRATVVDIDEQVMDLSRRYLPRVSQGSFDDPRCRAIIGDGAAYVGETEEGFDVIIVDSPDPVGPAKVLFARPFYENLARILRPSGTLSRQTGTAFREAPSLTQAFHLSGAVFRHCLPYLFTVPTYVGGAFSSVVCSNAEAFPPSPDDIEGRYRTANLETQYYSPSIHQAAFQLPPYLISSLDSDR